MIGTEGIAWGRAFRSVHWRPEDSVGLMARGKRKDFHLYRQQGYSERPVYSMEEQVLRGGLGVVFELVESEDIAIGFGVETLEVDQIVWEIERAERTDGRIHWKHLESSSGAPAQLCEHLCKHLCVA